MVTTLPEMAPTALLTRKQTADLLGISPRCLFDKTKAGVIRACKREGESRPLYQFAEIRRYFYTTI